MVEPKGNAQSRSPLVWLTRLSLDAPLVAILWQRMFARSLRVPLAAAVTVVLGIVVWLLYVLDRLLDTRGSGGTPAIPPRHEFYRLHGRLFVLPLIAAVALAASLTFADLGREIIEGGFILLVAVGVYFCLVHFQLASGLWRGPKELWVGLLFAIGTGFPVWEQLGRSPSKMLAPWAIFAFLCWLNCSGIEFAEWQHSARCLKGKNEFPLDAQTDTPHRSTRWMGRHAVALALAVAVICFGLEATAPARPLSHLYAAEALAGLGTALTEAASSKMSPEIFRVLMDVALLTPAILLPFLR